MANIQEKVTCKKCLYYEENLRCNSNSECVRELCNCWHCKCVMPEMLDYRKSFRDKEVVMLQKNTNMMEILEAFNVVRRYLYQIGWHKEAQELERTKEYILERK